MAQPARPRGGYCPGDHRILGNALPGILLQVSVPEQHLSSLVAERRRGLSRLRFSSFVEEEFRQYYVRLNFPKVRPLLVIAAAAVIGFTSLGIYQQNISALTAIFGLAVMLPLFMATLVCTYEPQRHAMYQALLALSLLCLGLIISSLTLRASLHGTPYHFAGQVTWIMVVWLALGLRFWSAAATSLLITGCYIWGLYNWDIGPRQTLFEVLMLVGVNGIGALCCFQLEATTRDAFRDKRMLEDQAERDGLTGLYNRRVYNAYMERIWRQSQREQSQLTVMLIDIDHFKRYNDIYGHQAGDDALKKVAGVIAMGAQRPLDLAARYGGEEFALVLYGSANDSNRDLPEQIRCNVEDLCIPHAGSSAGSFLTISIGVAVITPGAERSLAGAVQMADEALYQAKEEGRNRVIVKESRLTPIETGRFRADRRAASG
ncbi:MAG: GGDEF domain-containing protein [Gammaproteobacteria bacterium]|nr:GGDEF domain-containing protein [Gammaproteobacteria bacterium]